METKKKVGELLGQLVMRVDDLEKSYQVVLDKAQGSQPSVSSSKESVADRQLLNCVDPSPADYHLHPKDLDPHCYPILKLTADPTIDQIAMITLMISQTHAGTDPRNITSMVRKWFRERREAMKSRLIASFRRAFKIELKSQESAIALRARLEAPPGTDGFVSLDRVVEESKLEIESPAAAEMFARAKICAYINRAHRIRLERL